MPGQRKTLFLTIAGLILSIMMPAQNLPRLKADKAINKGTLGSGVVYYVVPNSSEKGFADFAVVRKDEVPSDETRKQARGIEGFMSRTGTGFRKDGLITDRDGSTVFRIDGVPVYDKSVLDSTLLYMFDFMSKSRSSQSVIISGDVDVADVKRKMDIFSMMVPRIYPGTGSDYVWEPSVAPVSVFRRTDDGDLSEITVTYSTARAPKEYMNTAQNLVMDIFAREFDVIVQRRLERMLPAAGIPYYRIETSHLGSDDSAGDEKYSVVVGTDKDHASDAMKAIATVLSSIGTYGPVPGEFADAKSILSADMKRLAKKSDADLSNAVRYLEKAVSLMDSQGDAIFLKTVHYYEEDGDDCDESAPYVSFHKAVDSMIEEQNDEDLEEEGYASISWYVINRYDLKNGEYEYTALFTVGHYGSVWAAEIEGEKYYHDDLNIVTPFVPGDIITFDAQVYEWKNNATPEVTIK